MSSLDFLRTNDEDVWLELLKSYFEGISCKLVVIKDFYSSVGHFDDGCLREKICDEYFHGLSLFNFNY